MLQYKHLFIDLDKTLWDFESNSVLALQELFTVFLSETGIPNFDCFHTYFKAYNHSLWQQYRFGEIDKEYLRVERFSGTLRNFGVQNEDLALKLADEYIRISPTKTKLYPNALEVCEKLSQKYSLHILTNGFSEVQFVKMKNSGLSPFFKTIITSEMVGAQKPSPIIFEFALQKAFAEKKETLMIGDDLEADILGAKNVGIDQVYVNYEKKPHTENPSHEVNSLIEILEIL